MKELFCKIIYSLVYFLAQTLDFIQSFLQYAVGLKKVNFIKDGVPEEGTILESLINSSAVQKAFFALIAVGLLLLFLFTVVRLFQSNFGSHTGSPRHAIASALKGVISFAAILLMVFAGIVIVNSLMGVIGKALSHGETSSLGSAIIENCLPTGVTPEDKVKFFGEPNFYNWTALKIIPNSAYLDFDYFPAIVMLIFLLVPVGTSIVIVARKL